jgi:hypothetical protein
VLGKVRNLFNMNVTHELYAYIVQGFRNLETGVRGLLFRDRQLDARVNSQGRAYIEIPAYLSAKFRIYQPDREGKATVMIIIDDLYAYAGERNGKQLFDNPVIWGRVQRNTNQGESLFFFNDPPAREAIAELKQKLVEDGVVDASIFEPEDVIGRQPRSEKATLPPPPVGGGS